MPVITGTQEVEIGTWFEARLGKCTRPYLKSTSGNSGACLWFQLYKFDISQGKSMRLYLKNILMQKELGE
jgi:hypothetical protein